METKQFKQLKCVTLMYNDGTWLTSVCHSQLTRHPVLLQWKVLRMYTEYAFQEASPSTLRSIIHRTISYITRGIYQYQIPVLLYHSWMFCSVLSFTYSWVPHCTTWWRRWFDGSRIQIIYVYPELSQHNIYRNRSSGLGSLNVPPHLLLALVVQQWHPIVGQWKSCTARLPLIAVVGVFVNCAAN